MPSTPYTVTDGNGNPLPLQLWKETITVPAGATGVTVLAGIVASGVVTDAWIDPVTLTNGATIKVYDGADELSTPLYVVDYTVPDPAVETHDALNTRARVIGELCCVVASATAGDSFDLYVWIDPNAEAKLATVDIGDVTLLAGTAEIGKLGAGTALIGKVGIDQTTAGTTDSVTVKSQAHAAKVSITRPANVTPYTAVDALGAAAAALTFAVGAGAGEYLITSAALEIDVAAIPSGMTSFTLHLYNVTPPSALADNAAWDLPSGDRVSYLGSVWLGSPVDLGSTLYVQQESVNKQVTLASANLFGYLVTDGGFTPAGNSEVYVVTLHTIRL